MSEQCTTTLEYLTGSPYEGQMHDCDLNLGHRGSHHCHRCGLLWTGLEPWRPAPLTPQDRIRLSMRIRLMTLQAAAVAMAFLLAAQSTGPVYVLWLAVGIIAAGALADEFITFRRERRGR